VLNRNVDSHSVGEIHLVDRCLEPEGKFVETQFQGQIKRSKSSSPIALQYKVEILRRASALSEPQFHRHAALEIVSADKSLGGSAFEHAADCKE